MTRSIKLGNQIPKPKKIARDLVMDIHNRIITLYDARTILRMIEPQDQFGFILPKVLLPHLQVEYDEGEMDYDQLTGDPELERIAAIYRKAQTVMVKSPDNIIV